MYLCVSTLHLRSVSFSPPFLQLWSPSQLDPLDVAFGKLPIRVTRLGQQVNLQGDRLMHVTVLLTDKEAGSFPKGRVCIHFTNKDLSTSCYVARPRSKHWGCSSDQDRPRFSSQEAYVLVGKPDSEQRTHVSDGNRAIRKI